ncbi:MAG TPA: type 4a pilus biogenesis protein PilO [Gaiellaceae bacterium]|nr:type 4a pilus biogenesis protein PilO [Gaiellaceae bacterium]
MTARLASLSPRAQGAVVAGVLLVVALLGYFVLISPKRSTAADLKKQTAAVQQQIDQNRSNAFTKALPAVRAASIFKLTQAMPSQLDTPDVILQLNQLADDSGLAFDQIQPGGGASGVATTTLTTDPFAAEPIQVQFTGNFYNLLAFLQRLRNLVRVENGNLFTAGRLFDVSDVAFAAGAKGFPQIQATLTINAFVPQAPAPTAAVPGSTDTTSTTTTGTTTTSNPTSAAPSTSGGTS